MTPLEAFDQLQRHLATWSHDLATCPESLACRLTDPDALDRWSLHFQICDRPRRLQMHASMSLAGTSEDEVRNLILDLNQVNARGTAGTFCLNLERMRIQYRAHLRMNRGHGGIVARAQTLRNDMDDAFEVLTAVLRELDAGQPPPVEARLSPWH